MSLNLALVITGDNAGAKKAVAETRADVVSLAGATKDLAASSDRVIDAQARFAANARRAGDEAAAGIGLARHEVGNLAAQLSDVGVSLASGQSPFMVMVQQGAQIGQIFGSAGLTSVISGVGQGLMSLINPVTLTLAAITGLSYAASWAYSMIGDEAGAANLTLEEQNDLISEAARRYGVLTPALAAYNAEQERRANLDQLKQAGVAASDQIYKGVSDQLPALSLEVAAARADAAQLGVTENAIKRVADSYATLEDRVANYTATGEDARTVQTQLNKILEATRNDIFQPVIDQVGQLIPMLDQASSSAKPIQNEFEGIASGAARSAEQLEAMSRAIGGFVDDWERLTRLTAPKLSVSEQIEEAYQKVARSPFVDKLDLENARRLRDAALQAEENKRLGTLVPTPTARPNGEDMAAEREAAAQKAGRADQRLENKTENLILRQRDRIELLGAEVGAMGQSTAARDALTQMLETEQQIRKLGIDAQGAEANAMRANTAEIIRLTQQRAEGVRQAREAEKAWSDNRDLVKGVIGDFTGLLKSGELSWKGFADAALNALERIITRFADLEVDNLLDAIMPKPGGSAKGGGSLDLVGIASQALGLAANDNNRQAANDNASGAVARAARAAVTGAGSSAGGNAFLDYVAAREGTAGQAGGGYNTSLGYGAFTGGERNLTGMTLNQIDALQTAMLRHPGNDFNSSALGRYQIVRTTRRGLQDQMGLSGNELFDEDLQDRMGMRLAQARGADAAGLGNEWASLKGRPSSEVLAKYNEGVTKASASMDRLTTSTTRTSDSFTKSMTDATKSADGLAAGFGEATSTLTEVVVKGLGNIGSTFGGILGAGGDAGSRLASAGVTMGNWTGLFGGGGAGADPWGGMRSTGGGGGGIFSSLLGWIPSLFGFAEGGEVRGPGTGTSDSILIRASNGEFMVNARATARNRKVLEHINAGGDLHGFANGGIVESSGNVVPMPSQGGSGISAAAPAPVDIRISVDDDGKLKVVAERAGRDGARDHVRVSIKSYDDALPDRVEEIRQFPRRRAGG